MTDNRGEGGELLLPLAEMECSSGDPKIITICKLRSNSRKLHATVNSKIVATEL